MTDDTASHALALLRQMSLDMADVKTVLARIERQMVTLERGQATIRREGALDTEMRAESNRRMH